MANEYIDGFQVHARVGNFPVWFARRRYGKTTFTWVEYHNGREWVQLGDPWPALNPNRQEIETAIKLKETA